jgi:hypothetical protein
VTVLSLGMLQISACKRKKMVLVSLVMPTSLCQGMQFFTHCLEPQISEQGIFDQLPVMGDGFYGDRVYYSIAVFFNFNNRACVLIMDKFARDRGGRGMKESQVNDVIQCLA